jgi:adenylylsulfate kinase-like enzyme
MGDKPLGVTFLHKKTVVLITTVISPVEKQIELARVVLQRM